MAREINVPKGFITRGDLPAISPDQIVVDHSDNTRIFKFDTASLEESLLTEGQKQPCVVRPLPDKRLRLVAGFRRHQAAMNIMKRQLKEGKAPEDCFKLQVTVQVMNAEEAMTANIIENYERQDLSPIECAHAIDKFRKQRGWIGDEGSRKIAALFRRKKENGDLDIKWVEKTEELLAFSESDQFLLHKWYVTAGREGMSLDAARILSKFDESKKEELLQAAVKSKQLKNVNPKGKPKKENETTNTPGTPGTPGTTDTSNTTTASIVPNSPTAPTGLPENPDVGPKLGITAADVKAVAAKKGIQQLVSTSAQKSDSKSKKRTVKEILNMFDPDAELDGPVKTFCIRLTDWIQGNEEDANFDRFKHNFLTGVRGED